MDKIRNRYVREFADAAYRRGHLRDDGTLSEALLSRAGVSNVTWWRWRQSRHGPHTDTLERLWRAMDELDGEREEAAPCP
ncbi:MAG: hypothetical protein ACLFQ3_09710 [Thiohalorhabdus sp.]